MNALGFAAVVVTGFIAGAEFGSYAFVHPVLRRLPTRERIVVEQGLLRTFGRVTEEGVRTTNPGLRNLRTTDNLGRGAGSSTPATVGHRARRR